MKIILISIGTRGDMEPFLAIGERLKEMGHQVICAFPEQFRHLAKDSRLEFASLGTKFIEMLDSNDGKVVLSGEGSSFSKFMANVRLAKNQTDMNKSLIIKQSELIREENPDRIVYNGKAIVPVIWELNNKGKAVFISPVPYIHFVKNHTHVAFNGNWGPIFNRLTFSLVDFGMIVIVKISLKWLGIKEIISRKQIKNVISIRKAIYTISPSLFPRPNDWGKHIKVLGYQERNKTVNWQPDKKLNDFIKKHPKILFITFGSMTNPHPEEKTKIILEILVRHNIPTIINTASGGLVKPENYQSEHIFFISQIPYDWILPKMYAVIHHGGSGTTHLALKYGCASMIIPHIIDQFVWNKIVFQLGAGPKGVKSGQMKVKKLESKILELINNPSFKTKAEQVAGQMKKENFEKELYHTIVE